MIFDQLGNSVKLEATPQRIVSLVPSQTELLFDLGLSDRIVGVTKFCIHPKEARESKSIIGGTKQFDFEAIDRLQPDFIIGNKEENYHEGIEQLRRKYPVFMTDIYNLPDALEMIRVVGQICDRSVIAEDLILKIQSEFDGLQRKSATRVLYFIWRSPWMVAGNNTFIHSMLERVGWINACDGSRYPELTDEQIRNSGADVVVLSSEPYPFKEKHIAELQNLLPHAKIMLVDGEMFSWYGSRLLLTPKYLNGIKISNQ